MRLLVTLLVAVPLIACTNQTTAKPATPDKNYSSHKNTYKSPGKPSMKIQMDYTVSKERVAIGETVNVSINFQGKIKPTQALVKTSKQLVLHGEKTINMQKSGGKQKHQFSVTPMTEGIHLITVVAEDFETSHKKPFAIRIIAGDKPIEEYLQTNGTLEVDENGEKIISMPAEER